MPTFGGIIDEIQEVSEKQEGSYVESCNELRAKQSITP